jgi:hypothetical protein
MTTYNDYDEIKWKLGEIHGVYQQQYEQEVRLIKDRLKHELKMAGDEDREEKENK